MPHIKPIVELCMALAGEASLEDPLRYIKGLSHEISRFPLLCPKKIYRLKEDQAFSLSLELGRSEKVAQHPSAEFLLHSVGGGW